MKTEKENKKFFPVFIDLSTKRVVVFGAGKIATRRAETLLSFAGELIVIAPACTERIAQLFEEGKLVYKEKPYDREDLYAADVVLAATDDTKVNEDIYSACKCLGIPVNTASNQQKCDFHFPGVVIQEEMTIGINASGLDHQKARKVREEIEKCLRDVQ